MTQWIDAMFVRGGTSKGLFFTDAELPIELPGDDRADPAALVRRDAALCAALGSPDPFGRQLDGMGGGASSLSKAMIVGRSARPGVDLDYTFAQVAIDEARVDYSGNCGNLSSGVAPFALAAGLVSRPDGPQSFTLFNTNTRQLVRVRLTVEEGQAAVPGDLVLPGVSGSGSPIELVYPAPGGSRTAGLLPSGDPVDVLRVGGREMRVSLVDATIPLVLVRAEDVGLTGADSPDELDSDRDTMGLLDEIRRAGAARMGLCEDPDSAPLAVPKITIVAPPADARLLDGTVAQASAVDLLVRPISMGQAHRAVPGTGAMCVAAAAATPGTIVAEALRGSGAQESQRPGSGSAASPGGGIVVRLGTPSGAVVAAARTTPGLGVSETSLSRTARVLMRGQVAIPGDAAGVAPAAA